MTKGEIIVSLDIGTSKIRAIIGEWTGSTMSVIGVGESRSQGIKKGAIVDIDETVANIRSAIEAAERMVDISIESAYVGVSGNHISFQLSHGIVAVSSPDREIQQEDIDRVVQAARLVALQPEREIIDVVPKQFIVDGLAEVSDPRGMIGVRLEVDAYLVTGARTVVHNLLRCVERAGIHIEGLVFMPLAASSLVLSADERKLGVCLVDVGAGSTSISIFEKGAFAGLSVLPIGSEYITNDIAIGLRLPTDVAETVKDRYGCALVSLAAKDETFKVPRIGSSGDKEFCQVDVAEIIEPRMQEIFSMVAREVDRMGYGRSIPGGYVLHGGGVSMRGTAQLAEFELDASVRIASPDFLGVRDPQYVSGVGVIHYVTKTHTRRQPSVSAPVRRTAGGFMDRVKGWFSEFI